MKSGPTPWTANCPQAVLAKIDEALDARDQSPREIYDALNLTRFCRFHTFRRYATQRRADRAARAEDQYFGFNQTGPVPAEETAAAPDAPPSSSHSPLPLSPVTEVTPAALSTATALCIEAITETLLAGRVGKLDMAKALRSLAAVKQVSIAEEADKRAAELHATKMAKAKPDVRQALQTAATPNAKGFREILEQVASGTLTVEAAIPLLNDRLWDEIDREMRGAA